MGALSSKLREWSTPDGSESGLIYWCQGCNASHSITTKGPRAWGWNGDVERPVFTPSVLTRSGHHASGERPEDCAICNDPEWPRPCHVCHTFVGCNGAQPGEVIFLGDCTHALAGTVQPLPDLPPHRQKIS